jgi:hypothetical protein
LLTGGHHASNAAPVALAWRRVSFAQKKAHSRVG